MPQTLTAPARNGTVLSFPLGLPGFAGARRMMLVDAGAGPVSTPFGDRPAVYWLEDADEPDLSFMCMEPWLAFPEYEADIDEAALGIADAEQVMVLVLLSMHIVDDMPATTANLQAPVVVDIARGVAHQIVLDDPRWPIRALIGQAVASA